MKAAACVLALWPVWALADVVVPLRPIPAGSVIAPDAVALRDGIVPGAVTDPGAVVGMEARVALYPGRPIAPADLSFPATVDRNQLIRLVFAGDALFIAVDGRALDRGGPGDLIRVMNLESRATVTARIGADGAAHVPP